MFMVQKGWLSFCQKPSVVFFCPVFALIVFSRLLWSLHVSALADIHDTPTAQSVQNFWGFFGLLVGNGRRDYKHVFMLVSVLYDNIIYHSLCQMIVYLLWGYVTCTLQSNLCNSVRYNGSRRDRRK